MAVTRDKTKVLVGYADIWLAPVGTVEPASATTLVEPTGPTWTCVGFTENGLEFDYQINWAEQQVEELEVPADFVVDTSDVKCKWDFAEDTIDNLALGMNATVATVVPATGQIGKKSLVLSRTLQQYALCFLGKNEYGLKTRVYVPSVGQMGSVGRTYKRASKRLTPVEFTATCTYDQISTVAQSAAALP